MEITGKIILIESTKSFGAKGFLKRKFVVETSTDQYPQEIAIEFVQDKCTILDSYSIGQEVKVSINIRGSKWTNPQGETQYFNSIQGWRIEKLSQADKIEPVAQPNAFQAGANEPDSDLPF